MSDARDPRRQIRSAWAARSRRVASRTPSAGLVAVMAAAGLAQVLAAGCADVEPTHTRAASASEREPRAPTRPSAAGAPRTAAPGGDAESDLELPTQRTVDARARPAPLELELPTQRVVRAADADDPRPKAPTAVAPPRTVDRVRVTVRDQRLQLLSNGEVLHEYPVSTAKNGVGSQVGSQRTPLGLHRVHSKFGAGEPLGTVFESRRSTGKLATIHTAPVDLEEDVITTRILWLEGLEAGKNRGKGVDSHARYIYIHGTNEEGLIGQPASHGCVRMRNRDVVELFELVAPGTLVEVLE